MNNLHTLTALIGREANANRTVIVQGFEARRRTLIVSGFAAVPALLLTLVLWPIIGQYATFMLPAVIGGVLILVEGRSRKGLKQRNYETLLDRRRSDAGRFYLCGREIDPDLFELGTLVKASVPNPELTVTQPPTSAGLPGTAQNHKPVAVARRPADGDGLGDHPAPAARLMADAGQGTDRPNPWTRLGVTPPVRYAHRGSASPSAAEDPESIWA